MPQKKKKKKPRIKKVDKPFKIAFTCELDDLIFDREDEEEIEYATPYVGTYIIRRMGHGGRRAVESSFVKIEASLKSDKRSLEIEDVIPDLSAWQDEIILHSLYDSPFGKRPYGGWGSQIGELQKFLAEMPVEISEILLEHSMYLNNFSDEERKN